MMLKLSVLVALLGLVAASEYYGVQQYNYPQISARICQRPDPRGGNGVNTEICSNYKKVPYSGDQQGNVFSDLDDFGRYPEGYSYDRYPEGGDSEYQRPGYYGSERYSYGPRYNYGQQYYGPRYAYGQQYYGPRYSYGQQYSGPRYYYDQQSYGPRYYSGQQYSGPRYYYGQQYYNQYSS